MPTIEYQYATWEDLSQRDARQVFELVQNSGQVDMEGITQRFKRCERFMLCKEERKLLGVGALKKRNANYIFEVFHAARSPKAANWESYPLELGYINVEDAHSGQGIGKNITRGLLNLYANDPRNIYATTRFSNKKINSILMKCGMTATGQTYASRNDNDDRIVLWINR